MEHALFSNPFSKPLGRRREKNAVCTSGTDHGGPDLLGKKWSIGEGGGRRQQEEGGAEG